MKNYETEARSRWGTTDAYREHEQKKITSRKKIATASCLSMPTPHGIIKS